MQFLCNPRFKFCLHCLTLGGLFVFFVRAIAFSPFGIHDAVIHAALVGDIGRVKRLAFYDLALSRTGYEEHLTPLGAATLTERIDVVRFLLNRKVDVNSRDDHGQTALTVARFNRQYEIAALLVKAGGHE